MPTREAFLSRPNNCATNLPVPSNVLKIRCNRILSSWTVKGSHSLTHTHALRTVKPLWPYSLTVLTMNGCKRDSSVLDRSSVGSQLERIVRWSHHRRTLPDKATRSRAIHIALLLGICPFAVRDFLVGTRRIGSGLHTYVEVNPYKVDHSPPGGYSKSRQTIRGKKKDHARIREGITLRSSTCHCRVRWIRNMW